MRIIVVEDDLDLAQSIADFLRGCGHEVTAATNAPQALQLVDSFEPDVVVVDIVLPVFDGNMVAGEIRRRNPHGPRLVALTANPELARAVRFDRILAKPVMPDDLARALAH